MKTLILAALFCATGAWAQETEVFDEHTSFETMVDKQKELERNVASMTVSARVIAVRRELGLTKAESDAAPEDIVLGAGTQAGITEGMILSVQRRVPILNPYHENQQSELEVEFATVKIIKAQNDLAIARLERIDPIKTGVAIGTRAILIGDYVGKGRN